MRLIDIEPVVANWKSCSEKTRKDAQELEKIETIESQIKALIMEAIADVTEKLADRLLEEPMKGRKSLRAKWIPVDPKSDVKWKCSNCWCVISVDWDGFEDVDFNYCPCCWAIMVGENK